MKFEFVDATKEQSKLRLALVGPSGSGKTYTGLKLGTAMANGGVLGVIDTERGSASKYANEFKFKVVCLESYSPENYVEAILAAQKAGFKALLIDSLSHGWSGKEGALEQVDLATTRSRSKNQFTDGWRAVTPMHNKLVDTMLSCDMHLIVTMRTKTEYVMEKDSNGRTIPRKVGLQPVQRSGMEYEFDVVADMDQDNNCIIDKTRCKDLKGKVFNCPGDDLASILRAWLEDGAPVEREPEPTIVQKPTSKVLELEGELTWNDEAGKKAWVDAVQAARKAGEITNADAAALAKKSQARTIELGIGAQSATNGAVNGAANGATNGAVA